MRFRRTLVAAGTALVVAAPLGLAAQASQVPAASDRSDVAVPDRYVGDVTVEYFDEDRPVGHRQVPAHVPGAQGGDRAESAADGDVHEIVRNGPVEDRLDVVFLGDGYTEDELGAFHADAAATWEDVTSVEPFTSHTELFNVWAVDAVSRDSGVSGDPTADVVRDTALASHFFCNDTERLLCVDLPTVEEYAALAPAADHVVVVSNSEKYGGAGYSGVGSPVGYDGVATLSAGHPDSSLIAVHEMGHSLGHLADEYWYDESAEYTGPETSRTNTSVLDATEMAEQEAKWHRWLGEESPDGGPVGTHEGADNHAIGLHRPTDNSVMRTLGQEFNLPGREAMIAGFYEYATVLEADEATEQARESIRDPALLTRVR